MLPAIWAALVTAILGIALSRISWPFVDLYSNLDNATTRSWPETFASAFGGRVEYRPLLVIGVKLAHQLAGLRIWVYQTLVIIPFAASLACLIGIFRPTSWLRAVAACLAVACLVGLHTSRVLFMFAPLNAHSFGLLLLLVGILLALAPRSTLREWSLLPLTLVALFVLESGALIVAVALVLWRMNAPGVGGRAVAATVIAAAIYAAVRLGFGTQIAAATYADTGIGFTPVTAAELAEMFANAPWLLWAYNYAASFLTVVLSEPTGGRYRFIESQLRGDTPTWLYIHLVTSIVTSTIVLLGVRQRLIGRDRFIAAAGVVLLLVGSVLGILYTRDRIALSAGAGYAMLVYAAVAAILERHAPAPDGRGRARGRAVAGGVVALVAAGWLVRTGETWFELRDTAWEYYLEWTTRYGDGAAPPQTDLHMILLEHVLEHAPTNPRLDPAWTYVPFEREYERPGERVSVLDAKHASARDATLAATPDHPRRAAVGAVHRESERRTRGGSRPYR